MPAYLVERSLPGLSNKHLSALHHALSEASRRLTASGSPVRYYGSTFLPARSRCFCFFEAPNADLVRAVNETAQVPFITIDEAIELLSPDRNVKNRRGERIR